MRLYSIDNQFLVNYNRISLIVSIILFFSISLLNAQKPTIRFSNLQKEDGLPNHSIHDIIKDNLGFIWIATEGGLVRYDGVGKMKVYVNEPQDTNKLQSSNIYALYNDSRGNLWIGTRLGGLTRFHQSSGTWTTFKHQENNPNSISHNEVLVIREDKRGRIWVGTENGLNVFNPETETFTSFLIDRADPTALQATSILTIMEDDKGAIWIGTWAGGLYLFLPDESNLAHSQFKQILPDESEASHNVWKILQDKQKRYWVTTHGGGVYLMQLPKNATADIGKQNWQPTFHNYFSDKTKPLQISNNTVLDILQDKGGNIWMGTVNGLNYLAASTLPNERFLLPTKEKPTLNFQVYHSDLVNSNSLVDNVVNRIFQDEQELLWLGTLKGISQYNWQNHQFGIHQHSKEDDIVSFNNLLYVPKKGNILMGTLTNGLVEYDLKNKTTKPLQSKLNAELRNIPITHLHSSVDSKLYLGADQGIIFVDLETQRIKKYPIPSNIKKNLLEFHIRRMHADKQGHIWVGTTMGLFVIDPITSEYIHFDHDPLNSYSISNNSINDILYDKFGYIWIATYKGLNRFKAEGLAYKDLKTIQFERFYADNKNLLSNRIIALEEVNDKLFLGTTNGLYAYDNQTQQFINYTTDESKFWVQSLEKTKDGNIWASTQEGIFHFDTHTRDFNIFGNKAGLTAVSFRHSSSFMDGDGWIYFGSRKGLVKLHPDKIKRNEVPPPVYITDIKRMNFEGENHLSTIHKKQINLAYDDYYLAINFAALNYNRPEKNKFAYKLEGFEENWNYTSIATPVTYTNLQAGEYTFKVKAANNDGYWTEEAATIDIIKKSAFWETKLFFFFLLLLFSMLLFLGFQFYSKYLYQHYRKIELYNQKLNKEIEERQRMEKILQAKNTELMRSNNDLEQFAYIASHDLQAPLRTISSFSRLLERSLPAKMTLREQEFFHFITDSIGNMQALVDDLLTFSRVNSQQLKIQEIDPAKLVDNILLELDSTIKETNARIILSNFPELVIADKIKLKQLLQNLITNGIKFSKPGVIPTVHLSCKEEKEYWQFEVKDNGIGIDKEFNGKIFKLFQRLHTSSEYKGTGIGLTLCKKIVEQHDGEIIVDSTLGEGSNFIFTISRSLN